MFDFHPEVVVLCSDNLCPSCLRESANSVVCPDCNVRAGYIPDTLPTFREYKLFFDEIVQRAQVAMAYLERKRKDN